MDFTNFAGQTLILYNDAPTAFPALVPQYDYYTGAPDRTDIGGYASSRALAFSRALVPTSGRSCRSR